LFNGNNYALCTYDKKTDWATVWATFFAYASGHPGQPKPEILEGKTNK
jgi:hypothetical protein